MSNHLAKFYLIILGITFAACGKSSFIEVERNEDSAVSEDAKPQETEQLPTSESIDPIDQPDSNQQPTESENCFEEPQDKTKVKLLTQSVRMNAQNQWLEYEVSLIDCWGNPKPIPEAPLLFDIDAVSVRRISHGLNFTLNNSSGESTTQGTLDFITGVDLFGQQGPHFFHWSLATLNVKNDSMKITLRVDVSNLQWRSYEGRNERINGGYEFSTFLRLGDASPVEQKVKWLNH